MTPDVPANVRAYRERVLSKVKAHLAGKTLLDVGCGDGGDAALFLPHFQKITAVDIERHPLWDSFAGEKLSFAVGDAEKLAYPVGSFDTVIEKDMLHHAAHPEQALKQMIRVASKKVIVLEANRYNPIFYMHLTLMGNHQHFNKKKFRQIALAASIDHSCEFFEFSARVSPLNNGIMIGLVNATSNLCEKLPFYSPIIEYNMAVITKA